jgi:hypothetical protein
VAPTRLALLANADSALSRHDLTTAFQLYRQAAADDERGEPAVDGRPIGPDLRDFARFRIVLLDAIVGQDDDARAVLEQLRAEPDHPFARLALLFWDSYGMTAEVATACRQVNQLIREDPDAFLRPLNAGPNGLGLTPDSVCLMPA